MKTEHISDFVRRVLNKVPSGVRNIGSFIKDSPDGELTNTVLGQLQSDKNVIDMTPFFSNLSQVKLACERKNMGVACDFSRWTFSQITNEIESIIDSIDLTL